MGYVFDLKAARQYDSWYRNQKNRFIAELEDQLLCRLLAPVRGERVLDIGCGTGRHMKMLFENGLNVTGLDASPHMLDIAKRKLGARAALHQGFAEDLPFEDNTFNVATLITTLEFVEDPRAAIEEACRVTKDRIFLGVLNRYAIRGIERRIKGVLRESLYNRARFFSVWEITGMVRQVLGKVPIKRGTVHQLPSFVKKYSQFIERAALVQRSPFGTFIGLSATLVPRYRTHNVPIKCVSKPSGATS